MRQEIKYFCEFCDNSFSNKKEAKIHEDIHRKCKHPDNDAKIFYQGSDYGDITDTCFGDGSILFTKICDKCGQKFTYDIKLNFENVIKIINLLGNKNGL